jgi:hypothetical protein
METSLLECQDCRIIVTSFSTRMEASIASSSGGRSVLVHSEHLVTQCLRGMGNVQNKPKIWICLNRYIWKDTDME